MTFEKCWTAEIPYWWCVTTHYPGQKVLRILHFLTHQMLIPWIWYHCGPSTCPTLVKVVSSGSEMIQPDINIVFLGGRGIIFSCQCFQELYLETRHGNIYFSQHFCLRLQIWFVVPHGKSASINQKHYLNLCSEETSGGFTKCWLFSQARWLLVNTVHII